MATFFSAQVGYWQQPFQKINGTLSGTVTRLDASHVGLSGLSLGLSSPSVYQGTKTLGFNLNGFTNTLVINGGSTYLGTFSLQSFSIQVTNTQKNAIVTWWSSDNLSGNFGISFPAYPAVPTVSIVSKTANSITLEYGVSSFGSATGTVTLNAGTSSSSLTAIDTYTQAGSTKTFTYTGLDADTTYYFNVVATNSDDNTAQSDIINTTTLKNVAMYGSVNNFTRNIEKIYGSVNGQTKEVKKIYGSVNGVTKRIF